MKRFIYFVKHGHTILVVFPMTGRTWALYRNQWTYRELVVLFLFSLEQFFPSLPKVIANRFVV